MTYKVFCHTCKRDVTSIHLDAGDGCSAGYMLSERVFCSQRCWNKWDKKKKQPKKDKE